MTSVLADTNAITWYLLDQIKLSPVALQALSAAERDHRLFVSAITLIEIGMEIKAGRLTQDVWDKLCAAMAGPHRSFTVLPVDSFVVESLVKAASTDHMGIAGRIIAATGVAHELPVVTESVAVPGGGGTTLDEAVNTAEREAIVAALNQCDQHRERAANVLGISVRTLHYKLARLGL